MVYCQNLDALDWCAVTEEQYAEAESWPIGCQVVAEAAGITGMNRKHQRIEGEFLGVFDLVLSDIRLFFAKIRHPEYGDVEVNCTTSYRISRV